MMPKPGFRPSPAHFAMTLTLLTLGLLPFPTGWTTARSIKDAARSLEPNHADREAGAGGYYEGLIDGDAGPRGTRSELSLRLLGKPTQWVRFQAANVSRAIPDDFLQFDLRADLDQELFGSRFTTNRHGMRDLDYPEAKPANVYRIALLGSSMDMGWGVGNGETYETLLENWLNKHAQLKGLTRRFEVLNFAVAAYGPAQRYASLSRRALAFDPDMVLYSATMLDSRLLELHLSSLLTHGVDPTYPFLARALAECDIQPGDIPQTLKGTGRADAKDAVTLKVRSHFWPIVDATLEALASECRSLDLPLVLISIPRASRADRPEARVGYVARMSGIAARLAVPYLDLMPEFDRFDTSVVEVASWDDHPNAFGHRRIFLGLARRLTETPSLYQALFEEPETKP